MGRIVGTDGKKLKASRKTGEVSDTDQGSNQVMDPTASWLKDEIDAFERGHDKFLKRGRKILKKYRDVRSPREDAITRYNILWANVQTRLPALYARNPKPIVERRYKDRDPVGRTAGEVLERSIEYTLDHCNDFFYTMRLAIQDYELPGLASVWVRYVPHFKKTELPAAADKGIPADAQNEETKTEGTAVSNDAVDKVEQEQPETISYEETLIDYVNWEDIGWSFARIWTEARLVWKRAYLDRRELAARFTDLTEAEIKTIPLDWSPKSLNDSTLKIIRKKAIVYEIHDKEERKRYWCVKNFYKLLDERDDDLGLHGFFPCPRPLMANTLSDELIPTPNFTFYQDQANEIDELSTRIVSITKALKVAGVRDASAAGLDRLLSEGVENMLVPVDGWAANKEKGGLAGTYELLPMAAIAETLGYLRDQRKELIEDVYQLTGIADIVRGFSDPGETATAQQMKGDFSMLRIQDQQYEVQRFARDIVRLVGQIVAGYDIGTLKAISGVKLLTAIEKQQLQAQLALQAAIPPGTQPPMQQVSSLPGQMTHGAPQIGGNMNAAAPSAPMTPVSGQAPASPEKLKLLEMPTWEEIEALLQNPVMREFRLDIETDSTIRMDDEAEKKSRIEFIGAVSEFLEKAAAAGGAAPEIVPMLGEIMGYVIRSFKAARPVEKAFDDMMEELTKASKQPKPNPQAQALQAETQSKMAIAEHAAQIKAQTDQAEQASQERQNNAEQAMEDARANHKIQLDQQLATYKAGLDNANNEAQRRFDAERIQFEGAVKVRVAEISATKGAKEFDQDVPLPQLTNDQPKANGEDKSAAAIADLVEHLKKPRKLIRGQDGKVESIQ